MNNQSSLPSGRTFNRALAILVVAATATMGFGTAAQTAPPVGASRIDDALASIASADPTSTVDALVVVHSTADQDLVDRLARSHVTPLRVFDAFGVVYVTGGAADVASLAMSDDVAFVSSNAPLEYYLDTASLATRAREAWDAKSTSTNPVLAGGVPVDGSGVGIAIVDSGIDGTHPDLSSALGGNRKFLCTTPGLVYVPTSTCYGDAQIGSLTTGTPYDGCTDEFWVAADNTDTTSGHGTHVAGIAAGRGTASDGRFTGAAPGATIYGLGVGEGISILYALEAFNWVLCNAATNGIRVVSNSWGLNAAFNPSDPINVATDALVSAGLVVLFAAGNDGGTGATDTVNTFARNPTPGVISVANFDDLDVATRDGVIAPSSSRCNSASSGSGVAKCPDVAAPGSAIVSARASTGATVSASGHPLSGDGRFLCCAASTLAYSPYYVGIGGTSMATPHVAGIAAMLFQASPALTPAAVEDVLEDTAYQFPVPGGYAMSDPSNPTTGLHHAAGHGLVDAIAALEDARVLGASGLGSPLPQLSQDPHVYTEGLADGQSVAGAPPAVTLQWTQVEGRPVDFAERFLVSGNPTTWGIASGQIANVRVEGPGATVTNLATSLAADSTGLQMSSTYTFPGPGDYGIEMQIDFGGGRVSFDAFAVRVV